MENAIADQIDNFVAEVSEIRDNWSIRRWSKKVATFLQATLGEAHAEEFMSLQSEGDWDELAMRQGLLQGIVAKARTHAGQERATSSQTNDVHQIPSSLVPSGARNVFVVHGHDEAAKEATARFLEKLDLVPIVLHEQASGGRTIIEKFARYSSDVGFAVVLLTPDDQGASQKESEKLRPRARQNVVLALGYFLGRLTRNRVCALHKGGIELPSDIQGVIYVEMDDAGGWKTRLAQELVHTKCPIKLNGLVNG